MKNSLSLLAFCAIMFSACKHDKPDSGGTTNPPPPPSSVAVSPGSFMLPARDTIVKVGVVASGAWKFEVASTGTGWVTAEKFTNNSKDSLKITIAPNTGTSVRTSKVTVSLSDGTQPKDITLTQTYPGAAPTLELENPVSGTFTFANAADTVLKPVIVTFSSWSAAIVGTAPWVMLEKPVGSGKDTLRLTVVPNGTTATRAATVRVTIPGTTLSKDITINQGIRPVISEPVLTVKEPSYNVTTTKDTTIKVEVKNAVSTWTAAVQGTATWLTATKKTGTLGVDTVLINLPMPNTTPSLRIGTVRVTSGTQAQDVTVTQGIYTPLVTCATCFTTITPEDPTKPGAIGGVNRLTEARERIGAATIGRQVLFIGGYGTSGDSKTTDILDLSSGTGNWITAQLAFPASHMKTAVSNNKVYAQGAFSSRLEIYNPGTKQWNFNPVSVTARNRFAMAATNNQLLIGGGTNLSNTALASVDVINTQTDLVSADFFGSRVGKSELSATTLNNKIYFSQDRESDKIDVYDASVTPNPWTISTAYESNPCVYSNSFEGKLYFVGYSSILTLDPVTGATSSIGFPSEISGIRDAAIVMANNFILIGGGDVSNVSGTTTTSNKLYIYDIKRAIWLNPVQLSAARSYLAAAVIDNKVFFAGGSNGSTFYKNVDVFTLN